MWGLIVWWYLAWGISSPMMLLVLMYVLSEGRARSSQIQTPASQMQSSLVDDEKKTIALLTLWDVCSVFTNLGFLKFHFEIVCACESVPLP